MSGGDVDVLQTVVDHHVENCVGLAEIAVSAQNWVSHHDWSIQYQYRYQLRVPDTSTGTSTWDWYQYLVVVPVCGTRTKYQYQVPVTST